ncbi:MAG: succinate--CoA ligase subunit alpha [Eubacteriales bacterium]
MSILINKSSRVAVQGITGRQASFHTNLMLDYGTNIVAGTSPGKGGQKWDGRIPVYETLSEVCSRVEVDTSIIFVPPAGAFDSINEAIEAGIKVVVCITDGIPQHQMMLVKRRLEDNATVLVGPNCPGVITPEEIKLGIMPSHIFKKGPVGVVSRSGSLSYEVVLGLTLNGIGQSTVVGVGGDPVKGSTFAQILPAFVVDPETKVIVLIGEIGGLDEEVAAEYIRTSCPKPVIAYIVGSAAPPGKKMGHAGAIVTQGRGTYSSKIEALTAAGVLVAETPFDIPQLVQDALSRVR